MRAPKTRIGILGCANIAHRSAIPAILSLPDEFDLVAVASRQPGKASKFAAEFGCEAVTGYDALVAREDLDALYIPLPTGLHLEWIGKAIEAGKHVYAEKSFASDLIQTLTLTAAATHHDVAVMEGYMFLYHRQHSLTKRILHDGTLGELRHFHGCFGFPPLQSTDFRYDERLGGGVLMDAAGYPLCAALDLLGTNLDVRASALHRGGERGTSLWGSAFLSNERGLGASIGFGFDNLYQCRYELWGSRGKLVADRAYTAGPTIAPKVMIECASGTQIIDVEPDNHFVNAFLEFRRIIEIPNLREKHQLQIIRQSTALQAIKNLSL